MNAFQYPHGQQGNDWQKNWTRVKVSPKSVEQALRETQPAKGRALGVTLINPVLLTTAFTIGVVVGLWAGIVLAH